MSGKTLTIGLEGCMIRTENMGCAALTWGLIGLLEKIALEKEMTFCYRVFENDPDDALTERLRGTFDIPEERLTALKTTSLFHPLAEWRHPALTARALDGMRGCDLFIDLTQGDSFTDIYGPWRFNSFTRIKEMILRMGKPLILGPQTYGPFQSPARAKRAGRVIKKARCAAARDELSASLAGSLSGREVPVLTDLAFFLPAPQKTAPSDGRVRVGVNVSSLLLKHRTEPTPVRFPLRADYGECLENVLSWLQMDPRYEVCLLPHVGRDGGEAFRERFPGLTILPPFEDPVSARKAIAGLDVLIASRMHAAIAALSCGTAVIPLGYSPKWTGLMKSLGYPFLVDLTALDTDEAAGRIKEGIGDWERLSSLSRDCRPIIDRGLREAEKVFSRQIDLCMDRKDSV